MTQRKAAAGLGLAAVLAGVVFLVRSKVKPPPPPSPEMANLYGVVKSSGSPLQGVEVSLDGISTITDSAGDYLFQEVEPGTYAVTFHAEGYEEVIVEAVLVEGNNELSVSLVPLEGPPEEPPGEPSTEPFSFSNLWVERVVCDSAPAWNTLNFGCVISNPTSQRVQHHLTPMYQVETKEGYGDPIARPEYAFDLTLDPGEKYICYVPGNQGDACTILVGFSAGVPYGGCAFLADERGNLSPAICIEGEAPEPEPETFPCPHCGEVFYSQAELKEHIERYHVPEQPGAEFSMPATLDFWIDHVEIVGYRYHRITFGIVVTNRGTAEGTYTLRWHKYYNGNEIGRGEMKEITLGPGENYELRDRVDIDFDRCHEATFDITGNWEGENHSEGYLVEGDVVVGNLIEEKHSEW